MLSLVFYHLPDIIYTIRDKKERTEQVSSSYKEPTPETPIVVEETKKEEKVDPVIEKIVKPVVPPPTQEKKDTTPIVKDTIPQPVRDTVIKVIDSLSTP